MSDDKPASKPEHYGFLQVPNYSMIAFSSAIEPLRMANRDAGRELYRWSVYTIDVVAPTSSRPGRSSCSSRCAASPSAAA
jgi:transcriptional regulator GlxA family with amidase domain